MKQLMKAIAIIIVVSIATRSQAQKGWRMGVAANIGHATDSYRGLTLGADARFQTNIGSKNFLILTPGVTHFFDTEKTLNGSTFVTFKAGIKTFFAKHLYLAGELGIGKGLRSDEDGFFLWSPSLGYSGKKIDISVKYEADFDDNIRAINQVALRLAYGFKL